MTTFFVSAGDASGELHAAALVLALRQRAPAARFLGLGGGAMEKAGVEIVVHQREIAVGGLVEVVRDVGKVVRAWRRLGLALRGASPDLVILVDAPDFNIPLARRARRLGLPVLYYVSPQVWAWRRGRIRKIARRVDRMAVIFPFEPEVYAGTGLRVDFVGHPLVDRLAGLREAASREARRRELGIDPEGRWVTLLPGSRRNEVRDTLPLQLAVARAVHARDPGVRFLVAVAPSIPRATVEAGIAEAQLPSLMTVRMVEDRTYEAVLAADVALAKPGTVTVAVCLLGTPLVVAARAHPVTAAVMRRLVKVPSFTMPNLI
ncbi:MAG: lipid-A-disaccharide synthase, partial [Myxococcota bacterium]|nr:lipid-A-disaccharide synthase [Myxococcota bacterium]